MTCVQASGVNASVHDTGVKATEALVICKQLHATLAAMEPGDTIKQVMPLRLTLSTACTCCLHSTFDRRQSLE